MSKDDETSLGLHKDDMRAVSRKLNSAITDIEFDVMWAEMQRKKRQIARRGVVPGREA